MLTQYVRTDGQGNVHPSCDPSTCCVRTDTYDYHVTKQPFRCTGSDKSEDLGEKKAFPLYQTVRCINNLSDVKEGSSNITD